MDMIELKRIALRKLATEFTTFSGALEEEFYRNFIQQYNDKKGAPLSMAFVYYCIDLVDRMYEDDSVTFDKEFKILPLWQNTNRHFRTLIPQEGDIVVWGNYSSREKKVLSGTLGIITSMRNRLDITLAEGFVNSSYEDYKENKQGLYEHKYSLAGSTRRPVIGYFRPWISKDLL